MAILFAVAAHPAGLTEAVALVCAMGRR